jgi:two-component system, OmpR family, manganese sensing response regulator
MPKLLLADDDQDLVSGLTKYLTDQGYVVETAFCGRDALQLLENFTFEVIILDWQLGDMSGVDVCKQFRKQGGKTPVIMLTGLSDVENRVEGLNSGADDYLTKPFEVRELKARLSSLLRRPSLFITSKLEAHGVSLEVETRTVTDGTTTVKLSQRETALLEFLMRHQNRNFSTAVIREKVWPLDSEGSDDTVRTCMKTLRQKLEKIGKKDLIKTSLQSGYIIES